MHKSYTPQPDQPKSEHTHRHFARVLADQTCDTRKAMALAVITSEFNKLKQQLADAGYTDLYVGEHPGASTFLKGPSHIFVQPHHRSGPPHYRPDLWRILGPRWEEDKFFTMGCGNGSGTWIQAQLDAGLPEELHGHYDLVTGEKT